MNSTNWNWSKDRSVNENSRGLTRQRANKHFDKFPFHSTSTSRFIRHDNLFEMISKSQNEKWYLFLASGKLLAAVFLFHSSYTSSRSSCLLEVHENISGHHDSDVLLPSEKKSSDHELFPMVVSTGVKNESSSLRHSHRTEIHRTKNQWQKRDRTVFNSI